MPMSTTLMKTPPATLPKRHTISQCSNIKKPTSPTIKVESHSLSPSPDEKTEGRSATGISKDIFTTDMHVFYSSLFQCSPVPVNRRHVIIFGIKG